MRGLCATASFLVLGLITACAPAPTRMQQNTPSTGYSYVQDVAGCDGVDHSTLQSAYDAALKHVRRKRWNEAAFRAQIKSCPATDLLYYQRVLRR